MNDSLLRKFSKSEYWTALETMQPTKSPGPDGLHAMFYQKYWKIIGDEVTAFLNKVWCGDILMSTINHTYVVLIRKINDPTLIKDFRPISLCNVLYKVLSKAVVLRLKVFLNKLVSYNQAAFVPSRLITDNVLMAHEVFHTMKVRSTSTRGVMALKLDMAKAYDRVEWDFLQKLLIQFGFSKVWVERVMKCVTTVSFSFIINGSISDTITPTRGIRQGDPLSPYFFILIAESLSCLIRNYVSDGRLTGVKASRGGPRIDHLLFADDTLLFCRASDKEVSNVLHLLHTYQLASGQMVNQDKSEVFFSKGVPAETRDRLHNILGMKHVHKFHKYLGLPTISGRSKKELFRDIKERVDAKVSGWEAKNLSQAGREVLIKSIGQAIPTYTMGVYRLPKGVIQDLHRSFANCWWGSKGGKAKIHWATWELLCEAKANGGLNFRDMEVFNSAILAKQAWRLKQKENHVLSDLYKAKYFSRSDILEAPLGHGTSLAWQRIWSAKSLLKEGLIWRVGTGENISVWSDKWVMDENGRGLDSIPTDENKDWKVNHLRLNGTGGWNEALIRNTFSDRDSDLILSIPLSMHNREDKQVWHLTNNGIYSVKTGYWFAKTSMIGPAHKCWDVIWKIKATPKAKNLLWRICWGFIPTNHTLNLRHIRDNPMCPLCNVEEENIIHTFFGCNTIRHLWNHLDQSIPIPKSGDTFPDILVHWFDTLDTSSFHLAVTFIWLLWFRRNNFVFQNSSPPDSYWITKCKDTVTELFSIVDEEMQPQRESSTGRTQIWDPPLRDSIKLNSDARLSPEGWTGWGALCRDHNGRTIFAAVKRVYHTSIPLVAEAQALLYGLSLAKAQGMTKVECESDCAQLISMIKERQINNHRLGHIIEDLLDFQDMGIQVTWKHICREANKAAHNLAAILPSGNSDSQIWNNACPDEILHIVSSDLART